MLKQFKILTTLALVIMGMGLTGCLKDSCDETRTFIQFETIFAHPDDFRIDISFNEVRDLEHPGKIYFYKNFIMINEVYEGIHIYDNTDSRNPQRVGFVAIPGNLDVAIKDDIMYADSYVDLLTIDFSDMRNPSILCRDEEVFNVYEWRDNTNGYWVGTRETPVTIEVDCDDPNFNGGFFWRGNNVFLADDLAITEATGLPNASGSDSNSSASAGITGVGGSFARFSVIGDYLYVIDRSDLISYSIETPSKPENTATTNVSWNIETLFPYKNYLFIGGNNGMFIYDRTNEASPTYVSEFRHAQACDPVYVKDDIAYVTLRNGTTCQNFINQLDVIDVSNINNPQLIESFDMDHPHGLAVRNNNIYICEGAHGLKVFENENLEKIDKNRIEHVKGIHAYDAISLSSDHLLVIGNDGLYQFDSSDPSDLSQISFISTVAE